MRFVRKIDGGAGSRVSMPIRQRKFRSGSCALLRRNIAIF
jgi:hypothetical protein